MTTKTTKAVVRETSAVDAHRNIIVILGPGDLLSFRLKGTRKTYSTTVFATYVRAVRAEMAAAQAAKNFGKKRGRVLVKRGRL